MEGVLDAIMSISIQRATAEDVDSLLLLMRHMQTDDPWSEGFDEATVCKNLRELLQNVNFGLVFLVHEHQRPVGYLVICFDYSLEYRGKGAWIDELFVEASYRGQGIGTQLLQLAERVSVDEGAQCLHLEVNRENRAIELYRKRGFVDHDRFLLTKHLQASN
jgi:GNAT superfamily N-acetyltransferase